MVSSCIFVLFILLPFCSHILCSYAGTEGLTGWMDGKREEALLNAPRSCRCASNGALTYLYFTEATQQDVRRVNVDTGMVERILGVGYPAMAPENIPAINSVVMHPQWVYAMANLVSSA